VRSDAAVEEPSVGSLLVPDRLAVWAWVLGYTALLTTLSVLRHQVWLATGFDLGMYEQGLWLIWHQGLLAASSFTGHPLLGLQASYLLIPLSLVYHLGGVGALLGIQAFSLGLGYLLLRNIAQGMGVPDRTAHIVGVAYLLFPVVLGSNLFDFHPVTLAVPMLLAAINAALRGRPLPVGVWLALALLTQDTLVVPVLLLGLVLLIQGRSASGGLAVLLAAVVAVVDGLVVLPHLGGPPAADWHAAIRAAAGIPTGAWGQWVHSLRAWEYLVWIFGPVAGLLLLGWRRMLNLWWVPALAVVAVNLGQGTAAATSPFNQWSLPAVAFMFAGLLAGLNGRQSMGRRWVWAAPMVMFLAVFGWHQLRTNWHALPHNITALDTVVAKIPAGVPVVAQNFALAQVANRDIALLPAEALNKGLQARTYVLLEPAVTTGTTPAQTLAALQARVKSLGKPVTVYDNGGTTLVRTQAKVPAEGGAT
jgi:hypothetical protein